MIWRLTFFSWWWRVVGCNVLVCINLMIWVHCTHTHTLQTSMLKLCAKPTLSTSRSKADPPTSRTSPTESWNWCNGIERPCVYKRGNETSPSQRELLVENRDFYWFLAKAGWIWENLHSPTLTGALLQRWRHAAVRGDPLEPARRAAGAREVKVSKGSNWVQSTGSPVVNG